MAKKQKDTPSAQTKAQELALSQELGKALARIDRQTGISTVEPENEFGKRLEFQRQAKELTQDQLAALTKQADKDGKGLSRSVISLYELGINRPGTKEIRLLCEVLKVSPSYFIYGDDDPFDRKAESSYFGGIAETEPEYFARAIYCLYRLDPEQSNALVQIMRGVLRSELKGFDKILETHADHFLLNIADQLSSLLNSRNLDKKP